VPNQVTRDRLEALGLAYRRLAAANRAKRQTIPAFRLRGHWMIDGDFGGDSEDWLRQAG
jgi:hypothetical protein